MIFVEGSPFAVCTSAEFINVADRGFLRSMVRIGFRSISQYHGVLPAQSQSEMQ